jgi:hypothetical protein
MNPPWRSPGRVIVDIAINLCGCIETIRGNVGQLGSLALRLLPLCTRFHRTQGSTHDPFVTREPLGNHHIRFRFR